MRIGVDTRHLVGGQPSGVDQYTLAVLREMTTEFPEHEFEILTVGSPEAKIRAVKNLNEILKGNNVTHTHLSIFNRVLNASIFLFRRPRLKKLFKKKPDVIWCPNINFIATGTTRTVFTEPVEVLRRMVNPSTSSGNNHARNQTPLVITYHDLSFELFKEHYNKKRRLWHKCVKPKKLARCSKSIIVPSKTTKSDLVDLYKIEPNKINVIPHGVSGSFDPRVPPQDHGIRSRYDLPRNYILHVGTNEPRKNLNALVEGFLSAYEQSSVLKQRDMKLVLVGASADATPDDHRRIIRLGYVQDEHMPSIYRQATALAFPSIYEGFGMPILEAFASNTPVITSQTSAMLEVGGKGALFVDPYNKEDIARTIEAVTKDKALREHLVQEGQLELEKYSWKTSARETMKVLESAL